jgi:hypothetical protein
LKRRKRVSTPPARALIIIRMRLAAAFVCDWTNSQSRERQLALSVAQRAAMVNRVALAL